MTIAFAVKKGLKGALSSLETLMPEASYRALLYGLLPVYKSVCYFLYNLKGSGTLMSGNPAGWRKTQAILKVAPHTLVGFGGLEMTYDMAKELNDRQMEGDFIELGVARGGCAALICHVAFNESEGMKRKVWLFDSYEGLPEPTGDDYQDGKTGDHLRHLPKGSCLGTLEQVKELLFGQFNFPAEPIEFVKGWFQDTLPEVRPRLGKIALLRLDGDWYESTKISLEHLYDLVIPDGKIVIDDYLSCYGCKKAVDEFLETRNLKVRLIMDGRGGCYFSKPGN